MKRYKSIFQVEEKMKRYKSLFEAKKLKPLTSFKGIKVGDKIFLVSRDNIAPDELLIRFKVTRVESTERVVTVKIDKVLNSNPIDMELLEFFINRAYGNEINLIESDWEHLKI